MKRNPARYVNLSWKSAIPDDMARLYNDQAIKIRAEFNKIVDAVSNENLENLHWWVRSTSSRNLYQSPLFHCFIVIALIKANPLYFDNAILLVDSIEMQSIVQQLCADLDLQSKVIIKKMKAPQLALQFLSVTRFLIQKILTKCIMHINIFQGVDKINSCVLVDTFIIKDKEEFDRYYTGIADYLDEGVVSNLRFVPEFFNYSLFVGIRAIEKMKNQKIKFLFKERVVSFPDILKSAFNSVKNANLKLPNLYFMDIEVSKIFSGEIKKNINASSVFCGYINYAFFKRLRLRNFNIISTIDWHENQGIDKAWNLAVKKYFPNCYRLGYQGYVVSKHFLPMFPTRAEYDAGVLPDEIKLIGRAYLEGRNEFFDGVKFSVAPAFRFLSNASNANIKKHNHFTVSVVFHVSDEFIAESVLKVWNAIRSISENVRLMIKLHPANLVRQMNELHKLPVEINYEIFTETVAQLLHVSDLFMSDGSSASVESILHGIPVVIFGNEFGLTHNPLRDIFSEELWVEAYDSNAIADAIKKFMTPDLHRQEVFQALNRDDYFEPATYNGVMNFLGFSKDA